MYDYTTSEREREREREKQSSSLFFIVLVKSSSFLRAFHRRAIESKSFCADCSALKNFKTLNKETENGPDKKKTRRSKCSFLSLCARNPHT